MRARSKFLVVAIATVMALVLAGCASQGGSTSASSNAQSSSTMSSSSASSSVSSSSSAASTASSSQQVSDGESVVSIGLDYNAGTGYEWEATVEPEGIVDLIDQTTEDLADDPTITGGPLRDVFRYRAKAPGEVIITFDLVRPWETDGEPPADTQVYAFTVGDDLNMILNPYKSNFQNEPEWGSNA